MILERDSKLVILDHWMEIVGLLHEIDNREGILLAVIGANKVALPLYLKDALLPHMGSKIAIIRTDLPGKEYLVRSIQEKKTQALNEINAVDLTKKDMQRAKAGA
jgi:hypothetical protein